MWDLIFAYAYVHNKSKLNIVYSKKKSIFEYTNVKAVIMRVICPNILIVEKFPCGWLEMC